MNKIALHSEKLMNVEKPKNTPLCKNSRTFILNSFETDSRDLSVSCKK
jgi:hypothetical protein